MLAFAVIGLGIVLLVAFFVVVHVVSRWTREWCEGMICAFGVPPLEEEKKIECADSLEKESIYQWILNSLFSIQRLAKLATSYLLS